VVSGLNRNAFRMADAVTVRQEFDGLTRSVDVYSKTCAFACSLRSEMFLGLKTVNRAGHFTPCIYGVSKSSNP
jgi:hypothetical protein